MKDMDYIDGRCKGCEHAKSLTGTFNWSFIGGNHEPYKGKWVAEIKNCPKIEIITDLEMYHKMQFLKTDDETLGCYIEGHYDLEQFERVAVDFLKNECDMERTKEYREVKVGYYKAIPFDDRCYYHFKEAYVRGAKKIMEMQYF